MSTTSLRSSGSLLPTVINTVDAFDTDGQQLRRTGTHWICNAPTATGVQCKCKAVSFLPMRCDRHNSTVADRRANITDTLERMPPSLDDMIRDRGTPPLPADQPDSQPTLNQQATNQATNQVTQPTQLSQLGSGQSSNLTDGSTGGGPSTAGGLATGGPGFDPSAFFTTAQALRDAQPNQAFTTTQLDELAALTTFDAQASAAFPGLAAVAANSVLGPRHELWHQLWAPIHYNNTCPDQRLGVSRTTLVCILDHTCPDQRLGISHTTPVCFLDHTCPDQRLGVGHTTPVCILDHTCPDQRLGVSHTALCASTNTLAPTRVLVLATQPLCASSTAFTLAMSWC